MDENQEKKKPDWDQKDVLEGKDNVTTSRGLQLWGDDELDMDSDHGIASQGTAERSAQIASGQMRAEKKAAEMKDGEPGEATKDKLARGKGS